MSAGYVPLRTYTPKERFVFTCWRTDRPYILQGVARPDTSYVNDLPVLSRGSIHRYRGPDMLGKQIEIYTVVFLMYVVVPDRCRYGLP